MPLVLSMALWVYKGMGTSVRWVVGSPCLLQGVFENFVCEWKVRTEIGPTNPLGLFFLADRICTPVV